MAILKIKINEKWVDIPVIKGKSAYDSALAGGYTGSEEEFNLSLSGLLPALAAKASLTGVESGEQGAAESLNELSQKITALESIVRNMIVTDIRVGTLDVITKFKQQGCDYLLTGTAAPAIVPDFVGQEYINTTAGTIYKAKGNSAVADWIQI